MGVNDRFTTSQDGLADTNDFNIDGSSSGTNVAEIKELAATGDCDVYLEVDEGQDGTFNVSIKIGSPTSDEYPTSGNWRIQDPEHVVGTDGTTNETRIRVNNTSGGAIDVAAVGYESGTN